MVQFNRLQDTGLYLSDTSSPGGSTWAYVLVPYGGPPDPKDLPAGPVTLTSAVGDAGNWIAKNWATCFVYFATDTDAITASAATWSERIADAASTLNAQAGMILFVASGDVTAFDPKACARIALDPGGGSLATGTSSEVELIPLEDQIGYTLRTASCTLSVPDAPDDTAIVFNANQQSGYNALVPGGTYRTTIAINEWDAALHFSGASLGAFTIGAQIGADDLQDDLSVGFQVIVPNPDYDASVRGKGPIEFLTGYFPLADLLGSTNTILFTLQVNFGNPTNRMEAAAETAFFLTGQNTSNSPDKTTRFPSYYRTAYGNPVTLIPVVGGAEPARLVVNPGYAQDRPAKRVLLRPRRRFRRRDRRGGAGQA